MGLAVLSAIVMSGSLAIAVTTGLGEARSAQAVANQAALAASDVSRGWWLATRVGWHHRWSRRRDTGFGAVMWRAERRGLWWVVSGGE
jgi:kynurenine formamidase